MDKTPQRFEYTITGLLAGAIGILIGSFLSIPKEVISKDLNEDKKSDIIIKSWIGDKYTFLWQENGTYKSLNQAFEDSAKVYEQNKKILEQKKKSIEAKVKDL